MRIWVDDDGEHFETLIQKRRGHVAVSDDQHEDIKSRAAELKALVEKHPYLGTAISDGWAKVCVQDDGNLGLEFRYGNPVSLSVFDEAASNVAKASAGCTEGEVRKRWVNSINSHRAEKVGRSCAEKIRPSFSSVPFSHDDVGF
jgi:hypothetical protein